MSLPELVLVFWLFAFVATALTGFATRLGRLAAAQQDRTRAQEVARAIREVLGNELRHSLNEQIPSRHDDSLSLRAIRGTGVVCGIDGSGLLLRYHGVRRPDPAKDSVLLMTSQGVSEAGAVRSAAGSEACGGSLRLTLDPPIADSTIRGVALVYERGTYSLAAGALRYARGVGGRQPLTEALLTSGSSLRPAPDALALTLAFRPDSLHVASLPVLSSRIRRLNGAPPW